MVSWKIRMTVGIDTQKRIAYYYIHVCVLNYKNELKIYGIDRDNTCTHLITHHVFKIIHNVTIPVTNIYVLDQNNQLILQKVISYCSINSIVFCKYFQTVFHIKVRKWTIVIPVRIWSWFIRTLKIVNFIN